MNQKISWDSGALDEIGLVYDKADENEAIGEALERLEEQALTEASTASVFVKGLGVDGKHFAALSPSEQEKILAALGGLGLEELKTDFTSATISVTFAPSLPLIQACTIFNLLNRLEKLDGAFNVLISDKATLLLRVPLGGKKGLLQWELLIMQLYPWLSVREESTNQVALGVTASESAGGNAPRNVSPVPDGDTAKIPAAEIRQKAKGITPTELFYRMRNKPGFMAAWMSAVAEVALVIRNQTVSLKMNGEPLTEEIWMKKTKPSDHLTLILALGNRVVKVDSTIHVEQCDVFPWCLSWALLAAAESGQIEKQVIEVEDGSDIQKLTEALDKMHGLCSRWEYTIAKSANGKIGEESSAAAAPNTGAAKGDAPKTPEKKSFWKRLFGK